jgi:hypothetical protein
MASEILRPNAAGDLTELGRYPDAGEENWEDVDEAEADEDSTYVKSVPKTTFDDLYNLPAHSGSGTINFIKVYFRLKGLVSGLQYYPIIKSNSTVTQAAEGTSPTSWGTYSRQWNTNPADSEAWEWADIDALQIGMRLSGALSENRMTQIYVEVDYTPPAGGSRGYIIG